MSRTVKSAKEPGDWWSRRPNGWGGMSRRSKKAGTMKWWKRNTHKRERQAVKQ